MISAEYDILGDEARRMVAGLAGLQDMTESETETFEREGGRRRWRMVKGVKHNFTHWWLQRRGGRCNQANSREMVCSGREVVNRTGFCGLSKSK